MIGACCIDGGHRICSLPSARCLVTVVHECSTIQVATMHWKTLASVNGTLLSVKDAVVVDCWSKHLWGWIFVHSHVLPILENNATAPQVSDKGKEESLVSWCQRCVIVSVLMKRTSFFPFYGDIFSLASADLGAQN